MRKYQLKYKDRFGYEETEISTDGSCMYFTLRGIDFEGSDLESLYGQIDKSKFDYDIYQDGSGHLTNFKLEIHLPIKLFHNNQTITESIKFKIGMGNITTLDDSELIQNTVELKTSFGTFSSDKIIDHFEYALIRIQNKLSDSTQLKNCLSCKYSNFHPAGNGLLGSLYCFKKIKEKATWIKNKSDLLDIWTEEAVANNDIFNVLEIYDCPDHHFISKNDWTYKSWDTDTNCVK